MALALRQQREWGIRFDTDGGSVTHLFEEPWLLSSWHPPRTAGIYAILICDVNCTPRPYRAIYFGQNENLAGSGFPDRHEKYQDWLGAAHYMGLGTIGYAELYVSIMRMPYSTETARHDIVRALNECYRPVCSPRFQRERPVTGDHHPQEARPRAE